jgi:hypothetical protein
MDKSVEPRQNLAKALYSRGMAATRAKDQATAAQCFHECLEIREKLAGEDLKNYRKKVDLLEVLARAGKHERAARLAGELRLDHQKNSDFQICAARSYAQASLAVADQSPLRRHYQEMALAALKTALEQGYKDTITLETHPDFDPVRDSPGIKQLLEKASAPRSPGVSVNGTR